MLTVAIAGVFGIGRRYFQSSSSVYHTLSEILATHSDWDVVQEPDRPGPYQIMLPPGPWQVGPVSATFRTNGQMRRVHVPAIQGHELCVVGLLPQQGGEPTYLVLKRKAEQSSPPGQTTR